MQYIISLIYVMEPGDKQQAIIKQLLQEGAEVRTVFNFAFYGPHEPNTLAILIKNYGSDVQSLLAPLIELVRRCRRFERWGEEEEGTRAQLIELMLRKGVDVNTAGYGGVTALLVAVYNDNKTMAKLLLDYGANAHQLMEVIEPAPSITLEFEFADRLPTTVTHQVSEAMLSLLKDYCAPVADSRVQRPSICS